MDFELSDEQRELADGIRRLCLGRLPLEVLRRNERTSRTVDRAAWSELAAAGVFAMTVPESAGGLGLGLADAAVVFEELGAGLVPGPLVATFLAAGRIEGAADGSVMVGLATRPRPGRPGTGVLPCIVEHLAELDVLVVDDGDGLSRVDPRAVDAAPLERPLDPLTPLSAVPELPAGEPLAGAAEVARWRRDGAALTGALQVGLARWACEVAVDYATQRHQFGRPIGSFQAVKHLCADMVVRTELARAAVHAGALTVDQPDVGDADRAVAGAKLLADEAALANGRASIQVHGGMGFTWEVPVHLAAKRARVLATHFGTAADRAAALADGL